MHVFNVLVSTSSVHVQREMHSSLAPNVLQNAFIVKDKHVCLQYDIVFGGEYQTISSLAINAFISSVISYLEVSSRDYLVAGAAAGT